jgi:signal transduction histidine kinase/DNA-binding response OmpR family regulator
MADPVKILHVEDNPDNRRLVRRILVGAGYQVLDAADGLEGIELAVHEQPDLILLDINMPRLDGYEAAAAMRAFPTLQSSLIVALTAYTNAGDRERILTAGCNGYIAKPIDVDRFPQQIEEFLRGKREYVEPGEQTQYLRELNRGLVQNLLRKIQELERVNRGLTARSSQLETLHHIGELITSQLNLQALAGQVVPDLAKSLGFGEIEVSLGSADTDGVPAQLSVLGAWPGAPTRSDGIIEVPLAIQGRITGRMRARLASPGIPPDEAEQVLRIVASQVAVAAENARLYEGLQRQMRELRNTEAQLVQSAKLAAIGELAANVAHEINNPMTSILGYTTLLYDETPMSSPRKETLKLIQTESLRIREIVRALLDFSRQRDFAMEPVDIRQAVRDTLALIQRHATLSNCKIVERFADKLPLVEIDVPQCKQVFLNLITNALDAMAYGGTLTVSVSQVGDTIRIEFADTGAGIPAANLPKIFDPFFTTKPAVKGTGLGLSVSLGIVQAHGGTIEVGSEPGKGSRLTVVLPLSRAARVFSEGG